MGTTVLGSYLSYTNLSNQLGARRFEIDPNVWATLAQHSQQWVANKYFLDQMVAAGDKFIFSSDPLLARPGSWFFRELYYLHTKHVPVLPPRQHMWTH